MFSFSIDKEVKQSVFSENILWDVIIIGGGPAGINAGLYAKRKGLNVGIITKDLGGQLLNTNLIDNYLGFTSINGGDLAREYVNHLKSVEVPLHQEGYVTNISKVNGEFNLVLSDGLFIRSKTVLIATGGAPRKLGVKGEEEFANRGVSYCATCDAPFFKDQHIIVVGGGNSSAEAIIDLSKWANKITVLIRSTWRADAILVERLNEIKNLTVHFNTSTKEIYGNIKMDGIIALNRITNEEFKIEADGMFVEIGTTPNSNLVKDLVELNNQGEIIVDENQMTSLEGLYAAGDVTAQPQKQIIIAAAEGAKAALAINQYLNQIKE